MSNPIIKIEIEHLKHCMIQAFGEELVKIDETFKSAIEEACKPEKIQAMSRKSSETAD